MRQTCSLKSHRHKPSAYALTLILLLAPSLANAITVEEILRDDLHITADYRQGSDEKPAILLLHGFLTVHTFSLIQKVADELADNNFTVLAPTLSLGISKRKSTLACDALHLHNMQNDIEEIHWWLQWLINKGHKNIILMGHSTGALQIIQYANQYPAPEIHKIISISLIPLGRHNWPRLAQSIDKAENLVKRQDSGINQFTLTYCDENYSSPANDFLSYARWNHKVLLEAIRNSKKQITVIMGGADDSAYVGWNNDMGQAGAKVSVIPGANHFFNTGHEFELYDQLMDFLKD